MPHPNSPPRPPSRLDCIRQQEKQTGLSLVAAAGIPQKLTSAHRSFPPMYCSDAEEGNKENKVMRDPKKHQLKNQQLINEHVFKRKLYNAQKFIENAEVKVKSLEKEVTLKCPFSISSQSQFNSQSYQPQQTSKRLVQEVKSVARRVKERIDAENAKRQERRKRKSIGEDAYIPFGLKELREKIRERSMMRSRE